MKIISKSSELVTAETFIIEHPVMGEIVYIEYLDQANMIIDCVLRNQKGEDILYMDTGSALLEEVQTLCNSDIAISTLDSEEGIID